MDALASLLDDRRAVPRGGPVGLIRGRAASTRRTRDYHQPETVQAALRGCHALFLLGPNLIEQTQLESVSSTPTSPPASATSSNYR